MGNANTKMTSHEVRRVLVDELRLDLIGPPAAELDHPLAHERLFGRDAPSRWYLTGFLEPVDGPRDGDDDAGDDIGGVEAPGAGDDNPSRDDGPAKKALMPSSMGLSVLVPASVSEVMAHVAWGHYDKNEISAEELEAMLARRSREGRDAEAPEPATDDPMARAVEAGGAAGGDAEGEAGKAAPKSIWRRVPHAPPPIRLDVRALPRWVEVPTSDGLILHLVARSLSDGSRILSVYLVNTRDPRVLGLETAKVFQAELRLTVASAGPGFVPRPDVRSSDDPDERTADLQYRDVMEYAVGHGVATATRRDADGQCRDVRTAWIPEHAVLRVDPKGIGEGIELDPEKLGALQDAAAVEAALGGLPEAYTRWIETQRRAIGQELAPDSARAEWAGLLLQRATHAKKRIARGVQRLKEDPLALEAFRLMNRALARAGRQRVATIRKVPVAEVRANAWRPFQLAFILLALDGVVDARAPDRKIADLLFFPTGGGKTEAYLGLAAMALLLRRLRQPDKPERYRGTTVLMRYTLRLLTLDQLGRAAGVVCALELERLKAPERLGKEPFEIGLWVGGKATPNRMGSKQKNYEWTARYKVRRYKADTRKELPVPLESCPWCGTPFDGDSFKLVDDEDAPRDLDIGCANLSCEPAFRKRLPIVTVDEPLYDRLPAFLIATVDKFALLPWFGAAGRVLGLRRPPEAAKSREKPIPPPDLVIQDELHLISGPLGTVVGLYETAIDALATSDDGEARRPKILASTATVRRADKQIRALFAREQVALFPPPGPDRRDSFFAEESRDVTTGRLYVGIAAQGRSAKVVLLRTYQALASAAQRLWDEQAPLGGDNPVDPYMTLLGYFGALRELGGSRRIVEDEVRSNLQSRRRRRRLDDPARRFENRTIDFEPVELTSRESTAKVAEAKARLSLVWAPQSQRARESAARPVDVALATNMISVGLDITRLGLMVALGQPKSSAEYIQATSRVGRDPKKPGLVVTLLNVHKPRDRSHYERFAYYHETFYRAVEAASVTPFSARALDRALPAVLVALARHADGELTPAAGAAAIAKRRAAIEPWLVATLCERAREHRLAESAAERDEQDALEADIRDRVRVLLDAWVERAATLGGNLRYGRFEDVRGGVVGDLLVDMLSDQPTRFRAPMSMREVEPEIPVWVMKPNGQPVAVDGD